jgi:hypothetical protein
MTFSEACRQFLEQHGGKWDSAKHRAQWESTLRAYAQPVVGRLAVAEIDVPLVLKVLEQSVEAERSYAAGALWTARPETANRLRGRMEAVLEWCKARGHRGGDNPAAWSILGKVLPAPPCPSRIFLPSCRPYAPAKARRAGVGTSHPHCGPVQGSA